MAARQPKQALTAKDKAVADRVSRAKRSYPKLDRHGVYLEALAELAQETGANVSAVHEEWADRCTAMLYTGDYDTEDAEAASLEHVRAAYRKAS